MSNDSSNNKKAKKMVSNPREEIGLVKQYLLKCPDVQPNSNAIRVCITALDNELKRMERDEKLRKKFTQGQDVKGSSVEIRSVLSDDIVRVEFVEDSVRTTKNTNEATEDDGVLNEWQEVDNGTMEIDDETPISTNDASALGAALAQVAVSDMSNVDIKVSTPTAALALVLHSALRSKLLEFQCTGVPDDEYCFKTDEKAGKKSGGGFAAPVRELPRGVFLPRKWDQFASKLSTEVNHRVLLRYRKNGMPATVLRVEKVDGDMNETQMKVSFGPFGGEPCEITFPIEQHVNLDGLGTALSLVGNESGVKPALHFKALAALLTDFCIKADLGFVADGKESNADNIAAQYSSVPMPSSTRVEPTVNASKGNDFEETSIPTPNHDYFSQGVRRPPTIQDDLLGGTRPRMPGGDFSSDLLPSGFPTPGFADPRLGDGITGNLMGPNHPYFHPTGSFGDEYNNDSDFVTPGGLGMQPRFDPFYPPGVGGRGPQGRGRGRGRGGRGRGGRFSSGDPNPDHQRPPNTFGGDMFM